MRLLRSSKLLGQSFIIWRKSVRCLSTTLVKGVENNERVIGKGGVWVEATPRVCLHDVHTGLRAGGLPPNCPVTFTALLIDENGKHFTSNAHYISSSSGEIDVNLQESIGGSYTGIFPAGLLSTLAPAPDEFQYLRLYKRDVMTPWKVEVSLTKGHSNLKHKSEPLATVPLERKFMSSGVKRIPIRKGRVRGTLFLPEGEGPFPGVLDMFGAIGGLQEFRSSLLASRGIASLALAYFAFEDLPKTTDHFELEYFEEAIDVLSKQPGVIKDRFGVISVSKSTDIAFALATWVTQVKAIVSINGSPINMDSLITYRGKTLAQGVKMGLEHLMIDKEGRLYLNRDVVRENFTPDHPQFIPINEADEDTHFLVVSGSEDAWSTDIATRGVKKRMDAFGKSNYEVIIYPGAGHIIEPPYGPLIHHSYHRHLPVVSEDGSTKLTGVNMLWGGNAKGTCLAQEDLWIRMRTFFMKHIRDKSSNYEKVAEN